MLPIALFGHQPINQTWRAPDISKFFFFRIYNPLLPSKHTSISSESRFLVVRYSCNEGRAANCRISKSRALRQSTSDETQASVSTTPHFVTLREIQGSMCLGCHVTFGFRSILSCLFNHLLDLASV